MWGSGRSDSTSSSSWGGSQGNPGPLEGFWNDWGGGRADKEGEFGPSLRTSSHFPTTFGIARALPVPGSTAGIKCIKIRQDPELKESVAINCRGREPSLNTSSHAWQQEEPSAKGAAGGGTTQSALLLLVTLRFSVLSHQTAWKCL